MRIAFSAGSHSTVGHLEHLSWGAWQGVWAYFNTGTDQTRRACETVPSAGKPGQTSHAQRRTATQRSKVTLHHAEWAEGPVAQKWNYRQKWCLYIC